MGLLDQVIGAALGMRTESAQAPPGAASQIAAALTALLASRGQSVSGGQPSPLGGLEGLVEQFKRNGLEDVINSWVGTGSNRQISPAQLHQALGRETVEDLSAQTGVPHDDLLSQLSKVLPGIIDNLTPNGRLPDQDDVPPDQNDMLPGPRT